MLSGAPATEREAEEARAPGRARRRNDAEDGSSHRSCFDVSCFDLDSLFAGLGPAPLLLAVSGGPDSLALLHLAARWGGAPLHVATVDHGLREASLHEAALVGAAATRLGLPHAVLPWLGPKPRTRIQERARSARYALLAEHARAIGSRHVLTAHHADDQAETVLFRLGRGSGPGGLAGMRRESRLEPGLALVRPLLGCRKDDLLAVCKAAGQAFADDPSNHDPAYARARLRAAAPSAAALGLDVATLTRLATRLARAEDALEAQARRTLATLGGRQAPGGFEILAAPLTGMEPEIVLRVLRMALAGTLPDAAPPRLDRLERLAAALHRALREGRASRATLGGASITLRRDTMLMLAAEERRLRGRRSCSENRTR